MKVRGEASQMRVQRKMSCHGKALMAGQHPASRVAGCEDASNRGWVQKTASIVIHHGETAYGVVHLHSMRHPIR